MMRSTPATDVLSRAASSSSGTSTSTYSRSHDSGTSISVRAGSSGRQLAREKQARLGRRERSYPEDTGATEDNGRRRFSAARWWSMGPVRTRLKLPQEAEVVLPEHAQIGDAVPEHRYPLEAEPECEPRDLLRVVADISQHVRVDHPRS